MTKSSVSSLSDSFLMGSHILVDMQCNFCLQTMAPTVSDHGTFEFLACSTCVLCQLCKSWQVRNVIRFPMKQKEKKNVVLEKVFKVAFQFHVVMTIKECEMHPMCCQWCGAHICCFNSSPAQKMISIPSFRRFIQSGGIHHMGKMKGVLSDAGTR